MAVSRDNNNVKLASATMRLYEVRKEISSRGMPQFNKSAVVGSHRDELMKVAALLRQEAIEKQDLLEKLAVGGRLKAVGGTILSIGKYLGKKLLPAAAKTLKPAGSLAGTTAAKTLKLPYTLARDTIKGTSQALGTTSRTIRNPVQTFKNYRSPGAAVQQSIKDYPASPISQVGSAARNLLRDTAGVPANSKTSIVGDLGRTIWNPSIPTAGRTASSLGTGTRVGGPILAANALLAGKGAVTKADEFIANQPITGNEKIDSYLTPESRRAFNREAAYGALPKSLWSGITGKNPVDSEVLKDLVTWAKSSLYNSRKSISEGVTESAPYSGKNHLINQVLGRLGALGADAQQRPIIQVLQSLHNNKEIDIEALQNSETYKGIVSAMGKLRPSGDLTPEQLEEYKAWIMNYIREMPSTATETASQASRHLSEQVSPLVRRSMSLRP
jgi:hypothetical protein